MHMRSTNGPKKTPPNKLPALPLLLRVESAHAVDKRPEKDPKTKMAGTSPVLGVESARAVDKRAEKDQKKKCQHSSFFSGYILSRTHHELDCQFMVGVSLSLSLLSFPLVVCGGRCPQPNAPSPPRPVPDRVTWNYPVGGGSDPLTGGALCWVG